MLFGRIRLTHRRLLANLRQRGDCDVRAVDASGIPDTDGSASGELFIVERGSRFAFVEVYHEDLPVLPNTLRSICVQLGLDEDEVCGGTH